MFSKMKGNMLKITKEAYGTPFSLHFFGSSFREKERGGGEGEAKRKAGCLSTSTSSSELGGNNSLPLIRIPFCV